MAFSTLHFRRLHPDARLPVRQHFGDAGLDLFSIGQHVIPPRSVLTVPTGLAVAIPVGFYGQITGRSERLHAASSRSGDVSTTVTPARSA